jgi:flagellar FliJ protein
MKQFVFPLEALLEKKKREEDGVKHEMALINKEIGDGKKRLVDLKDSLQLMQSSQKNQRVNTLDMVGLRHSVSFRNKIKLDMLATDEQIRKSYGKLSDIQQRLIAAKQQRRAIELTKEKRFEVWLKENRRKEQVFSDDISQQRFNRTKRKAHQAVPV